LLKADSAIKKYLNHNEIDELFDMSFHMKHIDTIFSRVFGE
jgi:adenylosuccinate lyase